MRKFFSNSTSCYVTLCHFSTFVHAEHAIRCICSFYEQMNEKGKIVDFVILVHNFQIEMEETSTIFNATTFTATNFHSNKLS